MQQFHLFEKKKQHEPRLALLEPPAKYKCTCAN